LRLSIVIVPEEEIVRTEHGTPAKQEKTAQKSIVRVPVIEIDEIVTAFEYASKDIVPDTVSNGVARLRSPALNAPLTVTFAHDITEGEACHARVP